MHVFSHYADTALVTALHHLRKFGYAETSRNGPVLVSPEPYMNTLINARSGRVSVCAARDANPFFHLMEALWMLAGRADLATLTPYVPRMAEFSDDGATLWGAYGRRWRTWFRGEHTLFIDQLKDTAALLRQDPTTRRAVIGMWDVSHDPSMAAGGGKDVPCNTQVMFRVRDGKLNALVTARSNDAVWGMFGANIVHFGFLLEWVAAAAGLRLGSLTQVANNMHVYTGRPDVKKLLELEEPNWDYLEERFGGWGSVAHVPLVGGGEDPYVVLRDIDTLLRGGLAVDSKFLLRVVMPMRAAHTEHKRGATLNAIRILQDSEIDWHVAGVAWLHRRLKKTTPTEDVR